MFKFEYNVNLFLFKKTFNLILKNIATNEGNVPHYLSDEMLLRFSQNRSLAATILVFISLA
jgi:hypothetical protein